MGIETKAFRLVGSVPGGVGDIFLPFVYLLPWTIAGIFAAAPIIVVRDARNRRAEQIDRDLPLFLELLATLSEAGLGFDAGLDRILTNQPTRRALAEEFRAFQLETLAGQPRVRSLRNLARRANVASMRILTSALVQAEQVGMGVAAVLRRQAIDLRERRRERALAAASTLPVKLLFPLVSCFLPAIFVFTLGPTFFQFFQFADTVIRSRGMR
jgi:tight adherence protein C